MTMFFGGKIGVFGPDLLKSNFTEQTEVRSILFNQNGPFRDRSDNFI